MSRRGLPMGRTAPARPAGVSAPTDRRFLRPEARVSRRTLRRVIVRLAAGVVAALAATSGLLWTANALVESRWLRVSRIAVSGATHFSAREVEALVSDVRGRAILRLNFDIYRRRLLDSPWVKDVRFSRRLPGTIVVEIIERTPMVIARLGTQLYLVDADGVVTDEYGPQYADLDFPIVDGLLRQPAGVETPVDPHRLALVSRLLAATADRPDLFARISHIDVTNPRDAVVLLDDEPVRLHTGETRFVERLVTYLESAPALVAEYGALDYADLRFDDRLFVKPRTEGRAAAK